MNSKSVINVLHGISIIHCKKICMQAVCFENYMHIVRRMLQDACMNDRCNMHTYTCVSQNAVNMEVIN